MTSYLTTTYNELKTRPLLVAELRENKVFGKVFFRLLTNLKEVPNHIYKCHGAGKVIRLLYEDAIKRLNQYEEGFLSEGKASIFNQSISVMKDAFSDARKKLIELRKLKPIRLQKTVWGKHHNDEGEEL